MTAQRLMVSVALCLAACHDDGLSSQGDQGDHLYDASVFDDGTANCKANKTHAACAAQAGCVADTCTACVCTPSFAGCRGISDAQTSCPAVGCPSPQCCHNSSDCGGSGNSFFCELPPGSVQCGACSTVPGTCTQDAECPATQEGPAICAPIACACGGSVGKSCQVGCTSDDSCGDAQRCGTDHRCAPRPCDSTCVGNYTCNASTCVRKPCTSDSACAIPGYCVNGACSKFVGQCVQPAA